MKTTASHLLRLLPVAAFLAVTAYGAAPNASFTVEIYGSKYGPNIKVTNWSREEITQISLIVQDPYWFEPRNPGGTREIVRVPDGGNATLLTPAVAATNELVYALEDFDYGEYVEFKVDTEGGPNDYRKILFSNGTGGAKNATLHVTTTSGKTEQLKFPDEPTNQSYYYFESASQPRYLEVSSSSGVEASGEAFFVPNGSVRDSEGDLLTDLLGNPANGIGEMVTIRVYDGETVEISVPQFVYHRDGEGGEVMTSSNFDDNELDQAMQRFEATGMLVNDEPQTGDPTLYRFTVDGDIRVEVKWRHDFALRVESNFDNTEKLLAADGSTASSSNDAVWVVGPLTSEATGMPDPEVNLHWITKGEMTTAMIDGSVLDFTHAGLDVRFVPASYNAYGSAIPNFEHGIDTHTNYPFTVGQAPPQRQQTHNFVMDGPAKVEYVWQVQYGIKVNIDDVTRNQLPLIYNVDDGEYYFSEGTYWFDPGTRVQVLCEAREEGAAGKALSGWLNGDGFFFQATGQVSAEDGSLEQGDSDHADWLRNYTGVPALAKTYHGMDIPNLKRPARVLWSYGNPAVSVTVPIGQYVFQTPCINEIHGTFTGDTFTHAPNLVRLIRVDGLNPVVAESDMTIWDDEAAKLYPLVPGVTRVTWSNDIRQIDVLVTAVAEGAHYPHIAGAPPVNIDPDEDDALVFKEIRYSENEASVDDDNHFTADQPGLTVLLFGEIQQQGRGQPREFLRVRAVQTRKWDDAACLHTSTNAIIGQAISDDELDRAKLGTGHVMFGNARYNPNVYDAAKLNGLAAQDIYDMAALQSTDREKIIENPDNLPGPIIPVNLHPGATSTNRIVVAWYADPSSHDNLLWPCATRTYRPRWPQSAGEGLGRIVIASQLGSDGLDLNGNTQSVVPAYTNSNSIFEEAFSYDPARIQQVQIYNQPDTEKAGYNPNEEHALTAPSLKHAAVSPRPPAIYALRNNDLNLHVASPPYTEERQNPDTYTSDPFVLVQFYDAADETYKMRVYEVIDEDPFNPDYMFADTQAANLRGEPHVVMEAGEPVIPFYPLGDVWGAVVPPETYGSNLLAQTTYWEDHKGSSWAISGGIDAWFYQAPYYPLLPDFWWPDHSVQVGDSLAFLPEANDLPTKILYKSEWPDIVPTLKAGETLTFSGGEYRADQPFSERINAFGEIEQVETPGLPAVLAFASAEVVFDSLNPHALDSMWTTDWTARIGQVLEKRSIDLPTGQFPPQLTPASGRTRISEGKYVFNELPASLQNRFRYDPVTGNLELFGRVNDKDIGDDTLTASPPAVYVLEPNILTTGDKAALNALDGSQIWQTKIDDLYELTRNPSAITNQINGYLAGLEQKIVRNPTTGEPEYSDTNSVPWVIKRNAGTPAPLRAYGPGLALLPNANFLDPAADVPDVSYVTVVENNDPALGGSPITPHVIKVDRRNRYRGSIKTVLSDNVFDENVVLRHQGDFGANADDLYFEWWYRPDDGSLDVPPPDDPLYDTRANPWKLFPDTSGDQGKARYEVTLKGNPNAPEALLADTWWFCRYRHAHDETEGIDWAVEQPDGEDEVNFTWAGAGNSDPLGVYNFGIPDYKAQLVMGWIKRVLDAVNPYEARIRDFEGDSPATVASMLAQFGARFEGPVALNPDKNVIENVGLIELYETILKRGRDLSIDLSRPVSTPAIANALQLAATRISDFYMLLANEAYTDALDPSIGVDDGSLSPAVFAFQNQMSSLIEEELCLLRGVDDNFARPVYNRLFWNFTKGEGEAAYAMNYNVSDVNGDGFIDEADGMAMYPQGHGDAWGHYLTALRNQYELLNHQYFNWVSRSEFYNLMDVVMKVDFLDERKFAQMAAAKAKAGAEIVDLTYREKYVEDTTAQWQGYTDSDQKRAWGVQGWARRAAQGAYFDWVTANALLPAEHPNESLEGIQKVDRIANADIAVVSANLNKIQRTFDHANDGYNPLGLSKDTVVFDIDPTFIEVGSGMQGEMHFDQIYDRAVAALGNAATIRAKANEVAHRLRNVGNSEAEYRNSVFQEDLEYRNQLIEIFGRPYEGTVGSGQLYPAGYDGPDLSLHMYIDVREINDDTVPAPALKFAEFDGDGNLSAGDMHTAFSTYGQGWATLNILGDYRSKFAPSFASDSNGQIPAKVESGLYSVAYTDLEEPKIEMEDLEDLMPVTTAGYAFKAPDSWGSRPATGQLQIKLGEMLRQEAAVGEAIAAWDVTTDNIIRTLRLTDAKIIANDAILGLEIVQGVADVALALSKGITEQILFSMEYTKEIGEAMTEVTSDALPDNLPTGGLAFSPGDALGPASAAIGIGKVGIISATGGTILATKSTMNWIEFAHTTLSALIDKSKLITEHDLAKREWLKELEDLMSDEPLKRVAIFKEIETLRAMGDEYRTLIAQGAALVDERVAYNKRVAAATQLNRYQDMTFRVARNHALRNYRASVDLAARYAYLAAKAYDYETNFSTDDPGNPQAVYSSIVKARSAGSLADGIPQQGGGVAGALAWLKTNYDSVAPQLGINNPQLETGKMSLRTECFRILPKGGADNADELWAQILEEARMDDLWQVPEFRQYCRAFAAEFDPGGEDVAQPGLVFRFPTTIMAGENVFGKPLGGGDHAYDPTVYSTKIRAAGIWFSDYQSDDMAAGHLAEAPRVYLFPSGTDVMRVPTAVSPDIFRYWNVVDQCIPVPIPALSSELDYCDWTPLSSSLNGRFGEARRFSSFRAYHDGGDLINDDELVYDTRLVGRSVWNTEWVLIIPGITFNADPEEGLRRFIEQVSDIKLVFETYGYSGN